MGSRLDYFAVLRLVFLKNPVPGIVAINRIHPDGHNPGFPLDDVGVGIGVSLGGAVEEAVGKGLLVLVAGLVSVDTIGSLPVMER